MFRGMYMAQLQPANGDFKTAVTAAADKWRGELRTSGVVAFALYGWERLLFVYVESTDDGYSFAWPEELRGRMERWPGQPEPGLAAPMLDIFHDGVPRDVASWREGRAIDARIGSLARLKPEQYASYVFYHYQLQEETPESFNKTYTIGACGNYIFSYYETPDSLSPVKPAGLLRTSNTPGNWHEVMLPHFIPWEDADNEEHALWRPLETLLLL